MDNFGEQLASAIAESNGSLEGAMRKILNAAVQKAVNDALQSETTALLGSGRHESSGRNSGDSRNGSYERTVATSVGPDNRDRSEGQERG